jgi:DNA-directed RNA polymerase specialized sigma24 family protein
VIRFAARMYDPDAPSSKRTLVELEKPRVRPSLVQIALWSTRSEADAEDLVSDALILVLDPEESPWVPPRTFLTHMTFVMRHLWDQRMRGARTWREVVDEYVTADKNTLSREPPADDELHRRRSLAVLRQLAAKVVAEIGAKHPIAKRCFELASQGIDEPEEQATLIGCPVEEIYDAIRKLRYHAQRIRSEWEAAEDLRMQHARERAGDGKEESRP